MISYILTALFLVEGIYGMVTGRMLSDNKEKVAQQYDLASYQKAARLIGVLFFALGIFWGVDALADNGILNIDIPFWTEIVVLAVFAVLAILIFVLCLKKKNGKKGSAASGEKYIDED